MAYEALYRRWRPKDFASLVGQPVIVQTLTAALAKGRIAHAYLFAGPRGTGKTSTARILAKALNCQAGPTAEPCGVCDNCRQIANGSSLDVLEIDAASTRGIDEMKELREQLAFAPVNSRYKIYIIDEVHMLTTEAFNALLKSLEEPPQHVIFILATTDPQKVPLTIHSRCQRFDFRRVGTQEISDHLAKIAAASGLSAQPEALRLIAIQAEGGLRDAISLLDQCGVMNNQVTVDSLRAVLGVVGREGTRELVAALGRKDVEASLRQLGRLLEQGKEAEQILLEVAAYLRALFLYRTAPGYEEIYLMDSQEALAALAPFFSPARLLASQERLHSGILELRSSLRRRMSAELCLVDLCQEWGSTLAALTSRVEELEARLAALGEARPQPTVSWEEVDSSAPPKKAAPPRQQAAAPRQEATPAATQSREPTTPFAREAAPVATQSGEPTTPFAREATPAATQSGEPTTPFAREAAPAATQTREPLAPSVREAAPAATQTREPLAPSVREATPAPQPREAQAPAQEAGPVEDLAAGQAYYQQLLELAKGEKPMLASCARSGTVTGFAGDVLQVSFKSKFLAERMGSPDFQRYLLAALAQLAGRPLVLECTVAGQPRPAPAAASPPAPAGGEAAPQGAEELPPRLRQGLAVLGGRVERLSY